MLDGGLEVLARRLHTMVTASDENQEGELTTVLVAASRESEAVGAILALPPVHIVGSGIDQGADPDRMLVITASQIVKMCGLAVRESARGAGIGIALMRRAMQLYTQLGYQLMYGQFTSDRGLASYYRRLGYEVSPPGSALSLACVGLPEVRLAASPFEQIIAFDRATT
jgi:GNAT superfamily N-acetyltransferase